MNFLCKRKDGGSDSPVDVYFLFEIKGLMSIALLKFNKGHREQYHTHAFNALTWKLCGDLWEERLMLNDPKMPYRATPYTISIIPKLTRKDNLHRVNALRDSWCLTIRGRWDNIWTEYDEKTRKTTCLTHGRKIVGGKYGY